MNEPTVSVHIVTYNSSTDIEECLRAVQMQTYPIETVVIIDNASVDGTLDKIRIIMETYPISINLMTQEKNLGFAPAHNLAIQLTTSNYALILNPDVTLDPNYITQIIHTMESNVVFGSVAGKLLLKSDPKTCDSTGLIMNRARRAFDRGTGEPADLWGKSGEVFGVSGAAALYSREFINHISIDGEFFDSSFFAYKEDVDVAWRGQLLGWKAYYDSEAIAYHERGWKKGGRSQQPLFIRRASYINRYKMIFKNDSIQGICKNFLKMIPYEIASHAYFLLREPRVLGAWKTLWSERRELRHKRNMIRQKSNFHE
ncbi:glycosyltransferase family 2 protein [Paenibacillus taichungensis]|uniref:glycosyltransferase family 2 protein n=1 Tax=Paenibacillus taichungensis TaxID=484184 RepID=UPI003D9A89A9